ncbi:amino acid permease [Acidobacteriota bacterium]
MKLSRNLGLFSVTMIGVGAMIGAGIFVLTGIAAGVSGPALLLAFLLNGVIAFFTASAYAELGCSLPQAGGGYSWVKESLPQPSGFISGWMSWMAQCVACSLYAVGFGAYFGEVLIEFGLHLPLPHVVLKKGLAVLVVVLFSFINFRGAKETGTAGSVMTILKILILVAFAILGARIALLETFRFDHFTPFFSKGFMGILTAMGLTYIAFEGYEIIAQSGEEIKNPVRNIPRAVFYSLLIVVPIYIVIAFVALAVVNPEGLTAWDFLAEKKEIAMVEAARSISKWGGAALLVGGLLSTISALNATIYSSSRVSFAMGRDFNLPGIFSRIHKQFKTPSGAIFVSSILVIIMLLLLPIEDIASSADVMFLFLFIFVNVALIHIRKKRPGVFKGYKSPLFPLFPVIGIITQSVLILVMFSYSPKSFFIFLLWVGMGLGVYYGYSRLKEKKEVGPQVVVEEKELAHKEFRIVVGIGEKSDAVPLMRIAVPVAKRNDGEIYATHIIPLPPQTPLNVGKRYIEGRKELLKQAGAIGKRRSIPVSYNIRASHKIFQGLLDSVIEEKGNVLILGSSPPQKRGKVLGRILDPIIQEAPCDVGILKIAGEGRPKKILVPTAGGPNAKLGFQWGAWIAEQNRGKLTLIYVARDETEKEKAAYWLDKTKEGADYKESVVKDKIVYGEDALKAIFAESENYDLVVLGLSREGLWKRLRLGTLPKKFMMKSGVSVLTVRKYEGRILSWLRRFVAG